MTAVLSEEEVQRVAALARLKLSAAELHCMAGQLTRILDYVGVLNELDTDDTEPLVHAVELSNVLRDDVVGDSLPREAALSNAPKTDGEYFLVPPILD